MRGGHCCASSPGCFTNGLLDGFRPMIAESPCDQCALTTVTPHCLHCSMEVLLFELRCSLQLLYRRVEMIVLVPVSEVSRGIPTLIACVERTELHLSVVLRGTNALRVRIALCIRNARERPPWFSCDDSHPLNPSASRTTTSLVQPLPQRLRPTASAAHLAKPARQRASQIGRASCRERG